jgi:transposase-like protein
MTARCDYAACSVIAVYPDQGWNFCWQHYLEHRADMYGEPWPVLPAVTARARRMADRREVA